MESGALEEVGLIFIRGMMNKLQNYKKNWVRGAKMRSWEYGRGGLEGLVGATENGFDFGFRIELSSYRYPEELPNGYYIDQIRILLGELRA